MRGIVVKAGHHSLDVVTVESGKILLNELFFGCHGEFPLGGVNGGCHCRLLFVALVPASIILLGGRRCQIL